MWVGMEPGVPFQSQKPTALLFQLQRTDVEVFLLAVKCTDLKLDSTASGFSGLPFLLSVCFCKTETHVSGFRDVRPMEESFHHAFSLSLWGFLLSPQLCLSEPGNKHILFLVLHLNITQGVMVFP